jgi:2-hydroxychromene-2-carboxylate isomerase
VGVLISLDERRRVRDRRAHVPASRAAAVDFAFDLSSPWTYLAAERVERLFSTVCWTPVLLPGADAVAPAPLLHQRRVEVEARAAELRVPLVWPERRWSAWRGGMRVAAYASERGRAGAFALAATRLAYCGGFDLDDPEIIAEAAAAAGLSLEGCLCAAGDPRRDAAMLAAGRTLFSAGADLLPAFLVRGLLFCGEARLGEAAAASRAPAPVRLRPPAS